MFPLFTPPSSEGDFDAKRRTKIMLILGLGMLALGGLMAMLMMRSGVTTTAPILFLILGIIVLLAILVPMVALAQQNQRKRDTAARNKAKRGLDGTDMYTLIDHMVDDLDDDEATYLRRRLDDRERGLKRDETKNALDDLLDERGDASREGWR